jgi:hypothetical protein
LRRRKVTNQPVALHLYRRKHVLFLKHLHQQQLPHLQPHRLLLLRLLLLRPHQPPLDQAGHKKFLHACAVIKLQLKPV